MSILDLFAKSPFKPMQEHMHVVVRCMQQMRPFFDALIRQDRDELVRIEREIDQLEGEADTIKNDLRAHLPKRLMLPVDRRDLLEILDLQDTIADRTQDIAELMLARPMEVPESMREPLMRLIDTTEKTCLQSQTIIDTLDELVEIGFRGREAERVSSLIDALGNLEGESDRVEAELMREVFRLESTLSPVDVIYWDRTIGWLGGLADHAEKAGNRIRLLIAH